MGDVRFASMVLLAANVVNALANKILIFGWFGLPAFGVTGSAWATLVSRLGMLLAIAWYVTRRRLSDEPISWRLDTGILRTLLKLGLPASAQVSLEVGVFSLATLLVARMNTTAAAAHQIVLQIASFHPGFQFEGTQPDDVSNATNQSPYPTLHLLREESVDRAVAAFPEAEMIYEKNIRTLEALGKEGLARLRLTLPED